MVVSHLSTLISQEDKQLQEKFVNFHLNILKSQKRPGVGLEPKQGEKWSWSPEIKLFRLRKH